MEHRHTGSNLRLVHPGSCMLHRLGNPLRKSRTDCMRMRTISWRRKRRHEELKTHHQEPERHHQILRLEHYRKELEIPHQGRHLPFHPGTQLTAASPGVALGVTGASATGITGSTTSDSEITGVSSGITGASYGVAGSTPSGMLGASLSGAAGPSLPEPSTETNRHLKRVHTLTIAEGHLVLRANTETRSICGMNTGGPRATGDVYGLRVHPQANL